MQPIRDTRLTRLIESEMIGKQTNNCTTWAPCINILASVLHEDNVTTVKANYTTTAAELKTGFGLCAAYSHDCMRIKHLSAATADTLISLVRLVYSCLKGLSPHTDVGQEGLVCNLCCSFWNVFDEADRGQGSKVPVQAKHLLDLALCIVATVMLEQRRASTKTSITLSAMSC